MRVRMRVRVRVRVRVLFSGNQPVDGSECISTA